MPHDLVGKSDLLQWVSTQTRRKSLSFDGLRDGNVLHELISIVFPRTVNHIRLGLHQVYAGQPSSWPPSVHWQVLHDVFKQLNLPFNVLDAQGIQAGQFRACWNILALFYWCHKLAADRAAGLSEFSCNFAHPLSSQLLAFLQSKECLTALYRAGALRAASRATASSPAAEPPLRSHAGTQLRHTVDAQACARPSHPSTAKPPASAAACPCCTGTAIDSRQNRQRGGNDSGPQTCTSCCGDNGEGRAKAQQGAHGGAKEKSGVPWNGGTKVVTATSGGSGALPTSRSARLAGLRTSQLRRRSLTPSANVIQPQASPEHTREASPEPHQRDSASRDARSQVSPRPPGGLPHRATPNAHKPPGQLSDPCASPTAVRDSLCSGCGHHKHSIACNSDSHVACSCPPAAARGDASGPQAAMRDARDKGGDAMPSRVSPGRDGSPECREGGDSDGEMGRVREVRTRRHVPDGGGGEGGGSDGELGRVKELRARRHAPGRGGGEGRGSDGELGRVKEASTRRHSPCRGGGEGGESDDGLGRVRENSVRRETAGGPLAGEWVGAALGVAERLATAHAALLELADQGDQIEMGSSDWQMLEEECLTVLRRLHFDITTVQVDLAARQRQRSAREGSPSRQTPLAMHFTHQQDAAGGLGKHPPTNASPEPLQWEPTTMERGKTGGARQDAKGRAFQWDQPSGNRLGSQGSNPTASGQLRGSPTRRDLNPEGQDRRSSPFKPTVLGNADRGEVQHNVRLTGAWGTEGELMWRGGNGAREGRAMSPNRGGGIHAWPPPGPPEDPPNPGPCATGARSPSRLASPARGSKSKGSKTGNVSPGGLQCQRRLPNQPSTRSPARGLQNNMAGGAAPMGLQAHRGLPNQTPATSPVRGGGLHWGGELPKRAAGPSAVGLQAHRRLPNETPASSPVRAGGVHWGGQSPQREPHTCHTSVLPFFPKPSLSQEGPASPQRAAGSARRMAQEAVEQPPMWSPVKWVQSNPTFEGRQQPLRGSHPGGIAESVQLVLQESRNCRGRLATGL